MPSGCRTYPLKAGVSPPRTPCASWCCRIVFFHSMLRLLLRWPHRIQRFWLRLFVLSLVVAICIIARLEWTRDHYLSPALVRQTLPFHEASSEPIPHTTSAIKSICASHGFSEYNKLGKRKIYDLVLLNTELDWLEIRLHTLAPYVDYFVIVESPTTFTGHPKPLYLEQSWETFATFHSKIIHRIVIDPVQSERIWDHEDWLRNSMLYSVFPSLAGTTQEARDGDVLVVSDMDELLRPETLQLLRYCSIPARLTLRTEMYYYAFEWRHRGKQWAHPDATVFQGISKTLSPNNLRQGLLDDGWRVFAAYRRWRERATLWNAGWHCSSCFARLAEMRTKMKSFSHQGWNTAYNRDTQVIMERVRMGLDLFGREGEVYDRVVDNTDVPEYIRREYDERGRFKYLLERDGDGAGFEDWDFLSLNDDET